MTNGTRQLTQAGVSLWLDDLSRHRIVSGSLSDLIESHHISGVTTNPAIFSAAITGDSSYDQALTTAHDSGLSAEQTIEQMICEDVRDACDLFVPVYNATNGVDGRVSIEVEPDLAHDTEGTIARAAELWQLVDRENAMIKIPATRAGIPAIAATLALGISVNVTLIFGLGRYREVLNAYMSGIEQARAAGFDISKIHSVASFFVSRLDSAVDPAFDQSDDPAAAAHLGKIAIANASSAYEIFQEQFNTQRGRFLVDQGAHVQRLLWASTGVKDSRFPADLYVTELVAPETVNTLPEATLQAAAEIEAVNAEALLSHSRDAAHHISALPAYGLNYHEVAEELERDGLEKFASAWDQLVNSVAGRLENRT